MTETGVLKKHDNLSDKEFFVKNNVIISVIVHCTSEKRGQKKQMRSEKIKVCKI